MNPETTTPSPATQTRGRARQEVSLIVQDELSIAGVTEETFAALKEEAAALSTIDPKTDAEVSALQKVITKGNNLKSTISTAIEPGKKWAHALHKAYTGNENEFLGTVDAIIAPLKAKKAAYVAEKERLEQVERERKEAAIRERLVAIEGYDFVRKTGAEGREDFYTNGITVVEMSAITMSDDEVWNNLLNSLRMVWEEGQAAKVEKERLAAEEAERLRLAQEAIERQQRELKEKQDAFNKQINEARRNELLALGCIDTKDGFIRVATISNSVVHSFAEERIDGLYLYSDLEWIVVRESAEKTTAEVREMQEKAQAAADREHLIAKRAKALKEAGWVESPHPQTQDPHIGLSEGGAEFTKVIAIDLLYQQSDETFSNLIDAGRAELARRKKAEEDRIAAEAVAAEQERVRREAERVEKDKRDREAKMSDVDKVLAWMQVIAANAPELNSAVGKHAVTRLTKYVTEALNSVLIDLRK